MILSVITALFDLVDTGLFFTFTTDCSQTELFMLFVVNSVFKMFSNMIRYLSFFLFALLAVLQASGFTVNGINYTISDGVATVTGAADNSITSIVIPATVEYNGSTYEVTTIGKNAFHQCTNATSLIFEDCTTPIKGVWYVDGNGWTVMSLAFKYCPLKTIYIGRNTSVRSGSSIYEELSLINAGTNIDITVAGNCTQVNTRTFTGVSIGTITFDAPEMRVWKNTFSEQTSLRKLVIEPAETPFDFEEADAFPDCPLDSVIIHRTLAANSATSSGRGFYNNKNIKHIICGSPISHRHSFYCPNLISFRILPTCMSIDGFGVKPYVLKTVIIEDCDQPIDFPNFPYALLDSIYIGRETALKFREQYRAIKVETGPLLTNIPNFLCYGHAELLEVHLHENTNTIGESAFYGCSSLTTLHLPDNITTIGPEAFANCTALQSINIPANLTSIPDRMLEKCSSLGGDLIIPANICSIGVSAFKNTAFSRLIIEDSTEPILFGTASPLYNTTMDYVYFGRQPEKETSNYTILAGIIDTVEFGENVHTIPSGIALGSSKVNHLVLSSNIQTLNYGTFVSCDNLQTILCKSLVPAQAPDGLQSTPRNFFNQVVVTVPIGCKKVYQADDVWGKFTHIRCEQYIATAHFDADRGVVLLNGNAESEIYVNEGKSLRIEATPTDQCELESISINGEPVEATDGVYEISELNDDCLIEVAFTKQESRVNPMNVSQLHIRANNGTLIVSGLTEGCSVYDVNGRLLYHGDRDFSIDLDKGVYVIHTAMAATKVVI